jgi:hypothetical protein
MSLLRSVRASSGGFHNKGVAEAGFRHTRGRRRVPKPPTRMRPKSLSVLRSRHAKSQSMLRSKVVVRTFHAGRSVERVARKLV